MLLFDGLLLAALLGLGAWRLLAPGARAAWRLPAAALVLAAALLHAVLLGFTWQILPAAPLLAVAAWPVRGPGRPWLARLTLIVLSGGALAPWAVLAVPRLPAPDGPYAVGTAVFRWTDPARPEPATADPADRRGVVVQAWHPAPAEAAPADAPAAPPYIDGLGRLPAQVGFLPRFVFGRFGQIETHARAGLPLAPAAGPRPVILFLPGYGAPRAAYTGLVARLASRGFVVMALDHPYEAAVTQLPDGRLAAGPVERTLPGETGLIPYMARQLEVRRADVAFALDRLAAPGALPPALAGRLDLTRVAVIGHSFGGAAAAAALATDPRVVAAANLDGTPYGDLAARRLPGPYLLIMSDQAQTGHSRAFLDGNARLLANAAPGSRRHELKGANHYSFTDAPLYLAPPARYAAARLIGGDLGPAETQRRSADLIEAFLAAPLDRP